MSVLELKFKPEYLNLVHKLIKIQILYQKDLVNILEVYI